MIKFVHTSDWQLGMTRHFLHGEAQARFTQARFEAIKRIGALAAAQQAEFVVVAGDVFESNQVDRQTVARACEALKAISVPTFLLPGNHDPLNAGAVLRSPTFRQHAPASVRVLDSADPIEVRPGVEVVGAPWTSKRPLEDLVGRTCATLPPRPGTVRVCVAHGMVDTLSPNPDDPALVALTAAEQALRDGRIHYLALGDRHSRTNVGGSGRIWYSGAPEPTDYDEDAPGDVLAVTLDEAQVTVEPHTVGAWRYLLHRVTLDSDAALDAFAAWLDALPDKERTILKLVPAGDLSLAQMARYEQLLDHAGDLCGAVEIWKRHADLRMRPSDTDFAALQLSGFARTALAGLRDAAAEDTPAGLTAREALALLIRLAEPPR